MISKRDRMFWIFVFFVGVFVSIVENLDGQSTARSDSARARARFELPATIRELSSKKPPQ